MRNRKRKKLCHHFTSDAEVKTTLTEKFLLYGGAIQQAGTVKGKRIAGMQLVIGWKLKTKKEFR